MLSLIAGGLQTLLAHRFCSSQLRISESSSVDRICTATIDDGVVRARVVVEETGCVPFWLPPAYNYSASVNCTNATTSTRISERTIIHTAPHIPSPCRRHSLAHGYYRLVGPAGARGLGTWMSSCPPPAVPCAPTPGSSVRLLGDSVIAQQAEHWAESFWAGSKVSISVAAGAAHRDRGTRYYGQEADVSYEALRLAHNKGNDAISVALFEQRGGRFAYENSIPPESHTDSWLAHLTLNATRSTTDQLKRMVGGGTLRQFDFTLFGFGYHQEWTGPKMKGRASALFRGLAALSRAPGAWTYNLNLPPDSRKIPHKYRAQAGTRTVLRTWQTNQAILEATREISAGVVEIADLFSPVLPYVEEVHCREGDAVHLLGCWEADMMRLQLLARMCTGDPGRVRFARTLSGLQERYVC